MDDVFSSDSWASALANSNAFKILPESDQVEQIVPWALKRQQFILDFLNAELRDRDYLLGKNFSTVDIMVGTTLMFVPETIEKIPQLQAYIQRLKNRPAFQRAVNK